MPYDVVSVYRISGVVPILCEELFKGTDKKKKSGDNTEYEVNILLLKQATAAQTSAETARSYILNNILS